MIKHAALLLALLCAVYATSWVVVDKDFTSIALANSFHAPKTGWVIGSSASLQPQILYTSDGGDNFDNVGLADSSVGAFFSADTTPDGKTGIAGGFGFFGLPCGAYMQDGKTWNVTHAGREIVCALTDANAIDSEHLVMTGVWAEPLDFAGNGVQVSTDGGKSWKSRNWLQGEGEAGPVAKYSSFVDIDTGFVTGGSFPQKPMQKSDEYLQISRYLRRHKKGGWSLTPREEMVQDYTGYVGIIAGATNAAKDFKVLVNLTHEGLYFNQIQCADSKNCWAAAEGVDKNTLQDAGWIYHTTDGWNTYDVQLTVEGGAVVAMSMKNATFGWAGGAMLEGGITGTFWQTTDGKSWSQTSDALRNFFVFDISTVDEGDAYASGVTSAGLSSFARYQT